MINGVPASGPGVEGYLRAFGRSVAFLLAPYLRPGSPHGLFATACRTHGIPRNLTVRGVSVDDGLACWYPTRQAGCSVMDALWPPSVC